MFSKSLNDLYIHIPKCAGSSIEKFYFNNQCSLSLWKHSTLKEYEEAYNLAGYKHWESVRKWTIIRNPWERFLSYSLNHYVKKNKVSKEDFLDWVRTKYPKLCKTENSEAFKRKMGPNCQLYMLSNNISQIDDVFRFENIKKDFPKLKNLNAKKFHPFLETCPKFQEAKEIFYQVNKKEFKQLGY